MTKIERRYCGDLGSNLMEGYRQRENGRGFDYDKGFLGNKFNGYESKGRKAWTEADIKAFEEECKKHPSVNDDTIIEIIIMGSRE